MSNSVQKMRANSKVLEQNCSICGAGFSLAEEVYQCSTCGGYHHVACWDASGTCPQASAVGSAESSPGQPSVGDSNIPPVPATTPLAASPPTAPLGDDERRCPTCAEVIKKEALKCRFCGHVFDSRYAEQSAGGFFGDTTKRLTEDKIRSDAKSAMIMSIVGIFCLGIILEPIALFRASRVLSQIGAAEREHGSALDIGAARGQAIAAVVIGICVLLLAVVYIIAIVASAPSSRY